MEIKKKLCKKCFTEQFIFSAGFCKNCSIKRDKTKEKSTLKAERLRAKKKLEREKITVKKLDTVFARAVKKYYPLICHACGVTLRLGEVNTQACHFVERGRMIVRWDIRNVLTGCSSCNGFDSSHVYELGKAINIYYGEGTAEYLRKIKHKIQKWSQPQLKEMFDLFSDYLDDKIKKEDLFFKYLEIQKE